MQLNLAPTRRSNLSRSVMDQLIQLITSGQLRPGDTLPSERDLCRRLQVGRSSIREAITSLTQMNVLKTHQGKRTTVTDQALSAVQLDQRILALARGSLADLYEVRAILEIEAATLAAVRRNEQDIEAIEEALRQVQEARDRSAAFDANACFHISIAAATHNALLENSVRTMVTMHRQLREDFTIGYPGMLDQDRSDHQDIFDAIWTGDSQRAREATRRHMQAARDAVSAPRAEDLLRDALWMPHDRTIAAATPGTAVDTAGSR